MRTPATHVPAPRPDRAPVGTLSRLVVYPLKSAGGIELERGDVERHGLASDRRWMLADRNGGFVSQRTEPRMARLRVRRQRDALWITAPDQPPLRVASHPASARSVRAELWGDGVDAMAVDPHADAWFTRFLGREVRLVHVPDDRLRAVDPSFAAPGDRVGFADGFPFLLTSEASLQELNARLPAPVPMDRFRPNLVVRGFEPFAEDGWSRIRIGALSFRVVKPCARCAITTVDQETAEVGREPLATLATFRRVGGKVLFGQNLIGDGTGTLNVGDDVVVEA